MKMLNEHTAAELAVQLARRVISAEDLVYACLERIEAREKGVQAWEFLDREMALAQARALDNAPVGGMLYGLPVGVKDIFDTCDMPTSHGSPIYAGHRPAIDSAPVALARRAGALILGKTVTTEFATFTPSRTRNPHKLTHTPGGSSSGSAASVADFMVPLALGTQTAGSVIRPGAYCGSVAYKPTYNTIPRAGVKPDCDNLDTVGVYGRSVADVALFTAALTDRPALRISDRMTGAPRIGVYRAAEWGTLQPEMTAAIDAAAAKFSAAGATVREFAFPAPFAGLREAHTAILMVEVARSLAGEFRQHPEKFSDGLRARCAKGYEFDMAKYEAALTLGAECRARVPDAMGDLDVLLVAGATGEAPEGLESTGDPSMNVVWTLLHGPAVTFPGGTGPRGLPVGLQVIGRISDDRRTLACADWMEHALAR